MNIDDFLSLLRDVRPASSGYLGGCPAHSDHRPSLSIKASDDGKILLHCHAGCSTEAIVGALGLSLRDLFADSPPASQDRQNKTGRANTAKPSPTTIEATYPYTDETGGLLYEVVRYVPKTFRQRRPDDNGQWQYNLDGVRRVPYQLLTLLVAIEKGERIYITEGERDVHALINLNLAATCNAGGAGKWPAEWSPYFNGADVVVLCDNDAPGRKHAQGVAAALSPVTKTLRVLDLKEHWPNMPEKGDVSDWFAAGGTADQLRHLADTCPVWPPATATETKSDATKQPFLLLPVGEFLAQIGDPPPMLVEGLLPDHALCLMSGKPKYGKSLAAIDLGTAIAAGMPVWGTRTVNRPGPVVYLGMEDGKFEIAARLLKRGLKAGSSLPFYISAERLVVGTEEGATWLRQKVALIEPNPSLVIVDTAREALAIRDYSDISEVTERLRPLREFAREVCTVLLVSHNRKAEATDAVDEIAGSNGFTSSVDGWISARRKEDMERDGRKYRRLFLDVDGRGGMRGSLTVEMDSETFHFHEVTEQEQETERTVNRQERDSTRFAPILAFLSKKGPASVEEIANAMNMNDQATRRTIKDMAQQNLVRTASRPNPTGRPSAVFDILT